MRFIGQPFREPQLGSDLRTSLSRPGANQLWFATAWAKRSGLSRLAKPIQALRDQRGHAEAIIGIDANGATREGLELAIKLLDKPYIYHDPGRTFHPKIYVVEATDWADLIIGSSNTTRGGMFTNYEAAVSISVNKSVQQDADFLREVRMYYDALIGSGGAHQLTTEYLDSLLRDKSVSISSETHRRTASSRSTSRPSMFTRVRGLLGAPEPDIETEDEDDDADSAETASSSEASPVDESEEARVAEIPASARATAPQPVSATGHETEGAFDRQEAGVTGFYKRLRPFDVSTTSAPGQMIIPIRFLDFFPDMRPNNVDAIEGTQSDVEFSVTFRDTAFKKSVTARAITYAPAPDHPRRNTDLRFTFEDREILLRLHEDDTLAFTKNRRGEITVERNPTQFVAPKRWGPLPVQPVRR